MKVQAITNNQNKSFKGNVNIDFKLLEKNPEMKKLVSLLKHHAGSNGGIVKYPCRKTQGVKTTYGIRVEGDTFILNIADNSLCCRTKETRLSIKEGLNKAMNDILLFVYGYPEAVERNMRFLQPKKIKKSALA